MAKVELLARLQNKHTLEAWALRTGQIGELRNEARKKGILVQDPKEFNPKLTWERKPSGSGFKLAIGFNPENKAVASSAYYCERCGGWIEGVPQEEPYNDLGSLSGSKGTNYNCGICDQQIGEFVEMMS